MPAQLLVPSGFLPALFAEFSDLTLKTGEGLLDSMPIRVALPLRDTLILELR
jgi:hypothetical protein